MNKNKGFSLTELLIVMAIIAIMVAMFTGTINPIAQISKANDSRRKKDLGRIKIAFEDYYNDNNCYPTQDLIVQLTNASNCGNDEVFSPWLKDWPCDPVSKEPYMIVVEDDSQCPDWFKIYANLENRNDSDIPEGWYSLGEFYRFGYGLLTINDANYGGSSSNVTWYEPQLSLACELNSCTVRKAGEGPDSCQAAGSCLSLDGDMCYKSLSCLDSCQVKSCGD